MNLNHIPQEVTHFHVCGGLGSGAAGFNDADPSIGPVRGKMVCVGGVDVDAGRCREFKMMTGVAQACLEHRGDLALRVAVPWRCIHCGGPRGELFRTVSYDGSRRLACDGWANPCGHVEKYSEVRAVLEGARETQGGTT